MIDRSHELPIARQAKALGVSRGAVYYKTRPVSAEDLKIMRRLDALHLDFPFAGSRMLRDMLLREGVSIGRRHVATLMKRMGIEAIYRRPNTSKPTPGHKVVHAQAARAETVGYCFAQFRGSSSSSRCAGWAAMRERTSASQA
jgi:putative transposase